MGGTESADPRSGTEWNGMSIFELNGTEGPLMLSDSGRFAHSRNFIFVVAEEI